MTFKELAKRAEKLVFDNSPSILTAIGVTGTVTTAYLTGKATFKAADILTREQKTLDNKYKAGEPDHVLDFKEKATLVWKLYIPAIGTGVLTIVCIICANRIGTRRAAAVAAAYSISEKAFAEYKDKVVKQIGEGKEKKVRDEIAQDRVNQNPVGNRIVLSGKGNGDILCYEAFTDRYFKSDMETIKKAQNELNFEILNNSYATLSDFYRLVGLPNTSMSSEVGWNSDKIMELNITTVLSEDDVPCISIDYDVAPIREYDQFK